MRLLSAEFLFDGEKLLKGYAVLLNNNIVIDIGRKNLLEKVYGIRALDFGAGVLFPGFVNLHTHIELSYLKNKLPKRQGFVGWLKKIMEEKRKPVNPLETELSIKNAVLEMYQSGVRVVGDISNTLKSCRYLQKYMPKSTVFFELYGLRKDKACKVKDSFQEELEEYRTKYKDLRIVPTAHSLYSTNRCLIKYLTGLNDEKPFSIHFLESAYEREFLNSEGEMFELLDSLGLIDATFKYTDVFYYVKEIGLYRKNVIFVHCTDAKKGEIEKIDAMGSSICLCLRSNDYISGNLPDVYTMENSCVNIGIGTDSLASNWDLNFMNELRFIHIRFNKLAPETVFRWAISGGAKALNIKFGFKKNCTAYDVFLPTVSKNPLEEILGSENKIPAADSTF